MLMLVIHSHDFARVLLDLTRDGRSCNRYVITETQLFNTSRIRWQNDVSCDLLISVMKVYTLSLPRC